MGQTDDLEEYDAELEIALKREYATVFPLFKYCLITQEATYLCNHFDMEFIPHSSYLLFEISMEDVWVWDRNRPTRIIPKAHVFTTSDVTVEQLKEDAGEEFAASLPPNVLEQLRQRGEIEGELTVGEAEPDGEGSSPEGTPGE